MVCVKCKKRQAVFFVTKIENNKQSQEGYCLQCAKELNIGPINQIMEKMGISDEEIEMISEQVTELLGDGADFEFGGAPTFPFMGNVNMPGEDSVVDNSSKNPKTDKKDKKSKHKTSRKSLKQYCTNLTEKAKHGEIDRIIGRENEISRAVQILCRRSKNNPCLIGEPGVGKTAIAEGLALKIANKDVPARLMDKEIHLLDLTALVAGTQFRGQFESRIKALVDEVKAEGNIILFIDEVHNIVGAGDAEGSMNAANILKPALSRGEIQVIGATTFTEYRKHIEKDAALERRFQPIKVEEPSIKDTYEMLVGIKDYYENYHKVTIDNALVMKTVTLSERYINDRFLPDKAIDLLDEACTCANLRNKALNSLIILNKELEANKVKEESIMTPDEGEVNYELLAEVRSELLSLEAKIEEAKKGALDCAVNEDDLAYVIQLWTGIPASKIKESDLNKLAYLDKNIKAKIIGQDEAVESVCAAVRRNRVQISPRRRPASFILVGPTGVGKTELVKQLSYELFDTPETLIRLDMSEFMEKHSVSRIIGSPPGYVGYDEAGQLTEKVRRKPYSVVLFDEIDKAHPDVMNILLQILDEGKINDAHGRTVSFENTIIIMTSNAGSSSVNSLGFAKSEKDTNKDKVLKALSGFLKQEFLGRVDEIIVFSPLSLESLERIAILMLDELVEPLNEKGITLAYDKNVPAFLAKEAQKGNKGARDLRNVIRRQIEDKITTAIVENFETKLAKVTFKVKDDKLVFKAN